MFDVLFKLRTLRPGFLTRFFRRQVEIQRERIFKGKENKLLPMYGIKFAVSRWSSPPTDHCSFIRILPFAVVKHFDVIPVTDAICVPVPVAARSKAWVCGRSLAGIAGSKPAAGMYVCLL